MTEPLDRAIEALRPEFESNLRKLFIHAEDNRCEHDFSGWRNFEDNSGGEQFCQKCGLGAMAHSMWEF